MDRRGRVVSLVRRRLNEDSTGVPHKEKPVAQVKKIQKSNYSTR